MKLERKRGTERAFFPEAFALGAGKQTVVMKPYGNIISIYINGEIESPENYITEFEAIRNAGDNDVIFFHINSYGGNMFTAIQLINLMSATKATTIAEISGQCASAATMIMLVADQVVVQPHTAYMFHDMSSGTFGKAGEMNSYITHAREWSIALFDDLYADILTPEEIQKLLDGCDIWFTATEMQKRLDIRAEKRGQGEEVVEEDEAVPEVAVEVEVDVVPKKRTPRKKTVTADA